MKLNQLMTAIIAVVSFLGVCQGMEPDPSKDPGNGKFLPNVPFVSLSGTLFDLIDKDILKAMEGYKQAPFLYSADDLKDLATASYIKSLPFYQYLESIAPTRFEKKFVGDFKLIENDFPDIIYEDFIKENCGKNQNIFEFFLINTENLTILNKIICEVEKISCKAALREAKKTSCNKLLNKSQKKSLNDMQKNLGWAKLVLGSIEKLSLFNSDSISLYIVKYEYFADKYSNPFPIFLGKYNSSAF